MIFMPAAPITVVVHNVTWGVAAGGYITLNNLVWPNYFGRLHLGAIRGIVLPATIAASALGAPLFGFLLDSGLPAKQLWVVSGVCFALGAICVLFARPPRRLTPHEAPASAVLVEAAR